MHFIFLTNIIIISFHQFTSFKLFIFMSSFHLPSRVSLLVTVLPQLGLVFHFALHFARMKLR